MNKNTVKQNSYAIKLTNVSKKYVVHHEKPTLTERILNGKNEQFYALKNINMVIKKGERVGLIGSNGSGKTTLLKLITGVSTPSSGKIETNGKIVSLIDLEAGFHPDLTGIENIYLNGMLLGMQKKEIDNKINEIIEFADIGNFIDAPIFTYSQGMKLRIGFSVAEAANPDILLLDENLVVGDQNFTMKVQGKIKEFFNKNKTVVFASHWLDFIKRNCNKSFLLHNGKLIKSGNTLSVVNYYKKHIN